MGQPGVTMTLLWSEYCVRATDAGAEPFMYSAFCQRHRQWARSNAVTMHIDRRPAYEMQVDWAGTCPRWCDPVGVRLNQSPPKAETNRQPRSI